MSQVSRRPVGVRWLKIARNLLLGLLGLGVAVFLFFTIGNAIWNNTYSNPANIVPPTEAELSAQGIKTIKANGLTFAYLSAGDPKAPLVLLFHGFPEDAHIYDALLPELANEGYYAVAVYMRGYYPTDIPGDGDYGPVTLGSDVVALIDAFGRDKAIVIGHDWGAMAGYSAANLAPTRISKLVAVAIPHPAAVKVTFEGLRRAPHFIQLQFGFVSEYMARRDNFAYIDGLYAYWSPNWAPPAADLARIKTDFARTGRLHAAVGYYTSFFADSNNKDHTAVLNHAIAVPTLAIGGDADILDPATFTQATPFFTGGYEIEIVHDAGHFVLQQDSDLVDQRILKFLAEK